MVRNGSEMDGFLTSCQAAKHRHCITARRGTHQARRPGPPLRGGRTGTTRPNTVTIGPQQLEHDRKGITPGRGLLHFRSFAGALVRDSRGFQTPPDSARGGRGEWLTRSPPASTTGGAAQNRRPAKRALDLMRPRRPPSKREASPAWYTFRAFCASNHQPAQPRKAANHDEALTGLAAAAAVALAGCGAAATSSGNQAGGAAATHTSAPLSCHQQYETWKNGPARPSASRSCQR
jgi:hypothetical protein